MVQGVESQRHQRLDQMVAQIAIALSGARSEGMLGAFEAALSRLSLTVSINRAALFRLHGTQRLRLIAQWHDETLGPRPYPLLDGEAIAALREQLLSGAPLTPCCDTEESVLCALHTQERTGLSVLVPMVIAAEPVGFLVLDSLAHRTFSPQESEAIGSVAQVLGGMLLRHLSEQKFRTLFEHTTDAVMTLDRDGFIECNRATMTLFGCQDTSDFVRHHPSELSPPRQADGRDSFEAAARYIDRAFKEGSCRFEWLHKRVDSGAVFCAEVLLVAMELEGEPILQAVVRDITHQKQLHRTLQAERDLFASGPCIVFKWEPEARWPVRYVSPNIETVFGYKPADLMAGKPPFAQLVHPEDLPRVAREVSDYLAQRRRTFAQRYRMCHADGSWRWIDDYTTVDYRPDGEPECINGYIVDITTQKQHEEQLEAFNTELSLRVEAETHRRRQSEQLLFRQARVATMGEMVSAISHHWRQPLSVVALIVQGICDDFQEGLLDEKLLDRSIKEALAEIQAMSRSIDLLRGMVPDARARESTVLEEIQAACQTLLPDLSSKRIDLAIRCEDGPLLSPEACAYPSGESIRSRSISREFRQVVFGLLLNARDAILAQEAPEGQIIITLTLEKGLEVVTIEDSGGGFDADALERAFEPFFTTKERGQGGGVISGAGTGLYIAKLVIEEQMGGHISIENGARGARVVLQLPLES